ncbi:HAD family hydrolase [soil metagenome]
MIVFDCDGVLVDSEAVAVATELRVLADHGVRFDRDTYVRTFTGLAPHDWHQGLADEFRHRTGQAPPHDLFDLLDATVERAVDERATAIPGAHAAVDAVDGPRCVASSTPRPSLLRRLRHTGLAELFGSAVFSADQVDRGKPAPDLFLFAATSMGVEPADCVVVEDSVHGVRAGRAAGMAVIGFTGGGHCPDGYADVLTAAGAHTVIGDFAALTAAVEGLRPQQVHR